MKVNNSKITGVLHQKQSQPHYALRRYFPEASLADLIEQFWLVKWDLKEGTSHVQQNLPDPNFHLVIENGKTKILGPVSKAYQYEMCGRGEIVGVKFTLGGLVNLLDAPLQVTSTKPSQYVSFSILTKRALQHKFVNLKTKNRLLTFFKHNSLPMK